MRTFGVPEVGFGVGSEDFAGVGDEGGDVEEGWFSRFITSAILAKVVGTTGNDGAGDDVDAVFAG